MRLTIRSEGTKLGELGISKGSIGWWPANKQSPISFTWERFARVFESQLG